MINDLNGVVGFEVINFGGEKIIRVYKNLDTVKREVHRANYKSFYSSFHYQVEHLDFTQDNLIKLSQLLQGWH
jgi:hypothetical protein